MSIVILAILAALAIPTFAGVITRSQDETTSTSLSSMLRSTQALVAFQDGTTWSEALVLTARDTAYTAGDGAYTAVPAGAKDPAAGEVTYASGDGYILVSMLSPSGRVCVGGATLTEVTPPTCLDTVEDTSSLGSVLSGDEGILPSGVPPTGTLALVSTTGTTTIELAWTTTVRSPVFTLERSLSPTFENSEVLYTGSALSHTDTTTVPGVPYHYRVTTQTRGTPLRDTLSATRALSAPQNVVPQVVSGETLVLNWDAVEGASSYQVRRSTVSSMAGAVLQNVTTNTLNDTGLADGTRYYYTVTAVSPSGLLSAPSGRAEAAAAFGSYTLGRFAWRVAIDQDRSRVFVTNGTDGQADTAPLDNTLLMVNALTGEHNYIDTKSVDPRGVAVSPVDGKVYFTSNHTSRTLNMLSVYDPATGIVTPYPNLFASSITIRRVQVGKDGTVFLTTGTTTGRLQVVKNGAVVASTSTVANPNDLTVSPDGTRVYVSSNGTDTQAATGGVTVVTLSYPTGGNVPTLTKNIVSGLQAPYASTYDPVSKSLYVGSLTSNNVWVINEDGSALRDTFTIAGVTSGASTTRNAFNDTLYIGTNKGIALFPRGADGYYQKVPTRYVQLVSNASLAALTSNGHLFSVNRTGQRLIEIPAL